MAIRFIHIEAHRSKMWSIFVAIAFVLATQSDTQNATVHIQGMGIVEGTIGHTAWTDRDIFQFHAIPYAQSPTGDLRFQPPIKTKRWSQPLDATSPGAQCPQYTVDNGNLQNEDCLTLSVFSNNLDTLRPVMVYIHGGWFFKGGAISHGPEYLLESDIVLVVIQYRLGPLGFLSTLSDKIPGNVGILDMIMALEWVQDYIRDFGGDSSQVTIFGESAGSAAVSALLHTPLVQQRSVRLFNKAILQSGSVFSPWAMTDTPIEGAHDIARRVGCSGSAVESCLQGVSLQSLLVAFNAHRTEMIIKKGYPSVAGTTLVVGGPSGLFPSHPKNYLWNATEGIDVMGGATSQDGLFLLNEIFIRVLHEKFGLTQFDGVMEGYELSHNFLITDFDQIQWKDVVSGLTDICGNLGIKGPVLAEIHAFTHVNPEHVYLYSFDYSNQWTKRNLTVPFHHKGVVHHAEDLIYLFPKAELNAKDIEVAKTMVQLWTSFAISGTPRAEEVPHWPPMNGLYGPYLSINEKSKIRMNYLNEFSATFEKYRPMGSGSNKFRMPFGSGGKKYMASSIKLVLGLLIMYCA